MGKIKEKDGFTIGLHRLPIWVPAREVPELPLFMKAMSPAGENLWFIYRVAVVERKWSLLQGRMLKLDWARITAMHFTSKDKALSMANIIAANNRNTPQCLESDIVHCKTLAAK